MTDYLRIFEAKALAEELTKAGHSISERTAQRWKRGVTKPKPQDIHAIRRLVGATLPHTEISPGQSFDWSGLMERVDAIAEAVGAKTPEERLLDDVDDGTEPEPGGGAAPVGGGAQAPVPSQ